MISFSVGLNSWQWSKKNGRFYQNIVLDLQLAVLKNVNNVSNLLKI